ncbi:MAG: hypothetical protein U0Q18_31765 [Bryobacteraceae bacterium]
MSQTIRNKRTFLAAVVGIGAGLVSLAAAQAATPKPGERADLVPFGHIRAWADPKPGYPSSQPSSPPWLAVAEKQTKGFWNIGVEWDEPREFSEVRVAFRDPISPQAVRVEYWVSAWPPMEGRGGWTETDTAWRGQWAAIRAISAIENGETVFRFDPLGPGENPNAKNRPGYQPRFRRALKLRLRIENSATPVLTDFQVLGSSRWNERVVRIETGCEGKPKQEPTFEVYNGRLAEKTTQETATLLHVLYLEHAPDSNDSTILTVGADPMHFGVAIDDLIRKQAVYVRDAGVFVGDGEFSFASYLASGRLRPGEDIYSRIRNTGEQSLERAMSEIPALSMMYRSGSHPVRYIPLSFTGNREKYGIDFNGNFFISKGGSKVFREEIARMLWNDDTLAFRIGTGTVPDFRERENSARQHVLDDEQPVAITEWTTEGVTYREEAFATLLDAPLDPWKNRGDEISALLVKLVATNQGERPQHAQVWLQVSPQEDLRLRDGILEGAPGSNKPERFRAVLQSSSGEFKLAPLPASAEYGGSGVRWEALLEPGKSETLQFRTSFRTLTDQADVRKLAGLEYSRERERVTSYWKGVLDSGMRLHVPDEILNRFYRAVLQHILISVQRDVPTGLYMDPCGTLDYKMFANETDMQVRLLDMRGLHDLAAKFVEPMVALQGSKPFPGLFQKTDAIFHGVRLDDEHDYTHSGYNLNHGWTLWTLAEHYLFTRDQEWLRQRLPKILKAADWIINERQATMRADENGRHVWEYGLLPPGQLEDNEEWQYWFAVNSYAYRGLSTAARAVAELDPEQGRRLETEAKRYRDDIRTAALRSLGALPVAPLRDGTWVPTMGSHTHLHGRDYGWIRNILYGPQVLVDCGVFSPDEPIAEFILRDLEDNLFMSPESFSVPEQDWFSRGGITLQSNLVNAAMIYLQRDEVPHAVRAFYNAFAVSYYPDVNAFTEWEPSFGKSGGPFFKTSDEAGSLAWLRMMLVREEGDSLYLASGAPRRWFRPDETIQIQGAATYFGAVGFTIESHAGEGHVDARIELPASFRAKEIHLRLRHPEGKRIVRVEIDGAPWTQFDAQHEWITFPASAGTRHVRAFF